MIQLSQSALVKSAIAAAVGLGVVVSISACGAGQVSQTATQAAAVNGATVRLGALTLADVQIIYPGTTAPAEVFTNGGPFQIAFYISNNDPVNDTKLVSITAPTGTITLDGDTTVPAGLVLRAGKPAGMIATQGQTPLEVTYTGAGKLVSPGLTVPLTFNFSTKGKASSIVVDTPVDAGSLMERKDKDPADSAEEGGHH